MFFKICSTPPSLACLKSQTKRCPRDHLEEQVAREYRLGTMEKKQIK